VIIGSGQDHAAFADLVRKCDFPNLLRLPDYTTDRTVVRRWLSAADAYVTASRIEGMPVAPLEAMACGLPVLASDAQGLPDILAEGEASGGLLLPQEAPQDFADGLKRLRDDAELRRRLGIAARRRVERHFSLQAVGSALDALLSGGCR
jgi:starch synthase